MLANIGSQNLTLQASSGSSFKLQRNQVVSNTLANVRQLPLSLSVKEQNNDNLLFLKTLFPTEPPSRVLLFIGNDCKYNIWLFYLLDYCQNTFRNIVLLILDNLKVHSQMWKIKFRIWRRFSVSDRACFLICSVCYLWFVYVLMLSDKNYCIKIQSKAHLMYFFVIQRGRGISHKGAITLELRIFTK